MSTWRATAYLLETHAAACGLLRSGRVLLLSTQRNYVCVPSAFANSYLLI